jgi:hypothetical protein
MTISSGDFKELGQKPVGIVGVVLVLVFQVLVALYLVYSILALWPGLPAEGGVGAATSVSYFFWQLTITMEVQLMAVVALSGALGSCVHTIRSLYWYIGHRDLLVSWVPMYLLRPLVGAILALVFYLVVRGGFFSAGASFQDTSPFGFAAMSSLVGLFSDQAVLKLKELAETLFKKPEPGVDTVK